MQPLDLPTTAQVPAVVVAGYLIGVVTAVMGVSGGELLIPTIMLLLYAVDTKTAGSLFARGVPADHAGRLRPLQPRRLVRRASHVSALRCTHGGRLLLGTITVGFALGLVPSSVLIPLRAAVLLVRARKVWGHR